MKSNFSVGIIWYYHHYHKIMQYFIFIFQRTEFTKGGKSLCLQSDFDEMTSALQSNQINQIIVVLMCISFSSLIFDCLFPKSTALVSAMLITQIKYYHESIAHKIAL